MKFNTLCDHCQKKKLILFKDKMGVNYKGEDIIAYTCFSCVWVTN